MKHLEEALAGAWLMQESGRGGNWGWGYPATRSWLELEHATAGGKEAEVWVGREFQEISAATREKAHLRQDLAKRFSLWYLRESLCFLLESSHLSPGVLIIPCDFMVKKCRKRGLVTEWRQRGEKGREKGRGEGEKGTKRMKSLRLYL